MDFRERPRRRVVLSQFTDTWLHVVRLAPPTHGCEDASVDMRHPSTPGRPPNGTRWRSGGSNRRSSLPRHPSAGLWMTSCPRPLALVTFAPTEVPPTPESPGRRQRVMPVTGTGKAALNWENVESDPFTVRLGKALSTRRAPGSQPVDKVVDTFRLRSAAGVAAERRSWRPTSRRDDEGGTAMEHTAMDLDTAWRSVVDDLQPNQRAWLRASEPVTLHESTAIIAVPNDFTRNQLEGRLRAQLEDALTVAFGREIRIAVTVNPPSTSRTTTPATRHRSTRIDKSRKSTCRQMPGSRPRPVADQAARPPSRPPEHGRAGHGASRPGSTPSTRSRPSSSARPTGSPTPPRSPSPRRPARPTTRCSSTATPGSARPTCCTRSATTSAASTPGPRCATSPARSSPTSSSTRSATTGRTGSSGATATSTCC